MDKVKHGLYIKNVDEAFLKHFMIFLFKVMGNSPLEFQAPSLSILSIAQGSLFGPLTEPKLEGNGILVQRKELIPIIFPKMVGNVLGNLIIHE